MALGKTQRKDLKAFSLKIKTKDLPKPEFVISERQGDKFVELPDRESTVSGTITSIEPKEHKWEGKLIKSVNLTLIDGDQIYFVTVPYSNLGRGLMNSLLNLTAFNDVEVGLYQTKPKGDGGKSYPAVSLRQGGEIVRWKYSLNELPAPKEIEFKGEKMRDWTEQEVFFATKLKEFNATIPKYVAAVAAPALAEIVVGNVDEQEPPF